jgi:hypothetical protein
MSRRFPAQIVAMCKEDMRDWVASEAIAHEESIAAELRRIVAEVRRLRALAQRNGLTVEEVLSHLERSPSAAA